MREFATTQGAVQVSKRPGRRQLGRVEAWRQVGGNVAGKSTRKSGKSLGKHLENHGKSMGNLLWMEVFVGNSSNEMGKCSCKPCLITKGSFGNAVSSKIQGSVSPWKNSLHAQPVFRQQSMFRTNAEADRTDQRYTSTIWLVRSPARTKGLVTRST